MASGGASPKTGGRGGITEVSTKTPSLKRTRSAQLGWLTQEYTKILSAVGKPNNIDRVSELYNHLGELWQRYENAHSDYLAEAQLSESKLEKLNEKHEDNRRNYCDARDVMRKYLDEGLGPNTSPLGTPREQMLILEEDEDLQRSRERIQQAERKLDRIDRERRDIERSFQMQEEDLEKMRENLQRLSVEKSRRRATDPRREPLASRPGSKPWLADSPRSPRQQPPLSRDLDEELQAAATATGSGRRSPKLTPRQGKSALQDVRSHIARSGSVATQTLVRDILTEYRQEFQEKEQASRPTQGQPQQQQKTAPVAPAHRVSQQPTRSSRDTAERGTTGAIASNQQHSSAKEESGREERTQPKSRVTQQLPERILSSSSSSDNDSDSSRDWSPPPQLRRSEQRSYQVNPGPRQSSRDRGRPTRDGSRGLTERQAAVEATREFTSGRRHDEDSRRHQSRRYERSTGRQDPEEYTTGRREDDLDERSTGRRDNDLDRRRTGRQDNDLDEYNTGRREDDLEENTTGRRDDDQERASTVSQEFDRRARNNGISVRATSDRGDLRR